MCVCMCVCMYVCGPCPIANLSGVFLAAIAELEYVALSELGVVVEVDLRIADHNYYLHIHVYIHTYIYTHT